MSRGDGKLYLRGNMIWVQGSINGKLYRKSTNKIYSSFTKKWFENARAMDVLKEMIEEETSLLSLKNISFEKFGLEVITLTSVNRGEATQKDILRIFKKHIFPYFKHYAMSDIKPFDIVKFTEQQKEKFSGDRAKRIKNVLGLILSYAHDNELIEKNPMETRTVKGIGFDTTPQDQRVYTTDEVNKILSNAYGWLRVFLEISYTSGLRVGEAMALQWEDFDLDNGLMSISRSISKGKIIVGSSGKKNHNRLIPLLPRTLEVLKSYFQVRPSNEWLFINKDGRVFLESKTIVNYHFKPFLKEIGVEYKTLQATRRTYASIMDFGGNTLSDTKSVMGHSENSTIINKHYIKQGVLNNGNYAKIAENSESIFNRMIGCN
ncbi:MAG: tyrosine-type recombinase/integrase [Sulfurimonas sp.]|nr:tyrosine-type recombinase/integrase [Sulfurimonas sp.]